MDIYWLQQSETDLPATDNWLTESESARLSSFRFAKRRTDWRLGRWTAKRAVAASLRLPGDHRSFRQIEIIAAATGQPEVTLHNQPDKVTISISHRGALALCAVASGEVELGCDLEMVEPRSDAFCADYFTEKEQELIARTNGEERSLLVSLLWSAKESALKALHVGLRADTRSVEVRIGDLLSDWQVDNDGHNLEYDLPSALSNISGIPWRSLQVQCASRSNLCGWWQRSGDVVLTIVATLGSGLTRASEDSNVIELTGSDAWSARP